MEKRIARRELLRYMALVSAGGVLVACQPKVVEKVVRETVIVEQKVEVEKKVEVPKEVTKIVEKSVEKVVTATPGPKEPVQLVHMERNLAPDIAYRKENIQNFQKLYPDIRITLEVMPEGYQQTIQARIAAGTAGDLWRWMTHAGMSKFTARGLFYPLDEFVQKDNYDLSVFFPGALKANMFQGKLYGLPINGHAGYSGVYYMPELWKEQGIPEPTKNWNYEEFTDKLIKLTKDTNGDGKTDQWGMWIPSSLGAALTPIDAFGGWTMNPEGTKATWDDPKTQAGAEWFINALAKWKVVLQFATSEARYQLWSSKKLGLLFSGVWEGRFLSDLLPKGMTLGFVPGPIGPSGHLGGYMGCNNYPIWRTSKHPYEAWLWDKYLASKELGIEGTVKLGEPGLRMDVFADPSVGQNPLIAPTIEMLKVVRPFPEPANALSSELIEVSQPLIDAMILGELSVKDGCAQLQKKSQEVMNRPAPGL